jgi:hypothetical protein
VYITKQKKSLGMVINLNYSDSDYTKRGLVKEDKFCLSSFKIANFIGLKFFLRSQSSPVTLSF